MSIELNIPTANMENDFTFPCEVSYVKSYDIVDYMEIYAIFPPMYQKTGSHGMQRGDAIQEAWVVYFKLCDHKIQPYSQFHKMVGCELRRFEEHKNEVITPPKELWLAVWDTLVDGDYFGIMRMFFEQKISAMML